MRSPAFRPSVESLETRETPTVLFTESFEAPAAPATPAGWTKWSSTGDGYISSHLAASTGQSSLASLGSLGTASRFFPSATQPRDNIVSIRVRTDGPAPMQVIARGQNLGSQLPTYLAAEIEPGGRRINLLEVTNGVSHKLAAVVVASPTYGAWVEVTLVPSGSSAAIKVKRLDTQQYLSGNGTWQIAETVALKAPVSGSPPSGQVGVGRGIGGQGMTFVDDFTVSTPDVPVIRQSFDTTAVGTRPSDWKNWTSDGTAGFAASSTRSASPANGYAAGGTSLTAARSWLAAPQPADVQASASLYADSLIPGSVIVRGSNLDTTTPTFYALSVTRGVEVSLLRVVNGVGTTLASVRSDAYTSYTWLRLTLTATGNTIRGVVSRADTGAWLTPDGEWADSPQPVVEVTDSAITSAGFVGLVRSRLAAGSITFDDVEVKAARYVTGPQFTLTASQPGTTFTGDVAFRVAGAQAAPPRRVEIRLDGQLRVVSATTVTEWTLDTTMLANGSHQLVVRALDEVGNVSTQTLTFTTSNANPTPPPARPELPAHYDHIRIAQLAYYGNQIGAFEQARLQDSVDLVIPNVAYLNAINQASPDTPQLVYTNLSNFYEGMIPDWLNYADRNGVSRELAFYHVTQATAFSRSSASAQPVTSFWSAYKGPAGTPTTGQVDVTSASRGGQTSGITLGPAGQAVAIGNTEKFREMNFTLTRAAGAGWSGVLEYVSAVAADGTPTAWKTLPILANGTNGWTTSGRVTFDPPADWVPAAMGGSSVRYFYVRLRATAGTEAASPIAMKVLGRDYVGANGSDTGVIPAFDYAADQNGDGYLNDAEYAARAAGKDARFIYESRLFYPNYGQSRYVTNPADPTVRRWEVEFHKKLIQTMPLADGFFLDNSSGRLPINGISVLEPTTSYSTDFAALVSSVWSGIAPKMVFANTAGGWADGNSVAQAATGVLEEFVLRATEANWANVADVAALVQGRLSSDNPPPYVILDSKHGSFATDDPRLQSATLAYYYLVADPDRTMLMLFGGDDPSASWSTTWIPAVSTDVGQPLGAMTTFATGADPQNAALTYKVFRRDYENAMVLYKPRSYKVGSDTATIADATATTHQLGGNYRVLKPDGTLGPVITSITLRNGEGAVLMKA